MMNSKTIYCPNCNKPITDLEMQERNCYSCHHDWELLHVLPVNDIKKHTDSHKCHCEPRVEYECFNIIVVHNSFDGREGVEWANEIIK